MCEALSDARGLIPGRARPPLSTTRLLQHGKHQSWARTADGRFGVCAFPPKANHHRVLHSPADRREDDSTAISLPFTDRTCPFVLQRMGS